MKDDKEIFLELLHAIANRNLNQLDRLIHQDAIFEFPYALPSRPTKITGKKEIIDLLSQRRFSNTLQEPIYIDSTTSGDVYIEITSEETFDHTKKSYSQHLICKGKIINGQVHHYKEFFNPITRLQGLLDLADDNIVILNE